MKSANHVGSFLKLHRKMAKLSQEQVAEKIGVTYQFVSRIEVGKTVPPDWYLKEIVKILPLDKHQLMIALLTDCQMHYEEVFIRKKSS